MTSPEFRRDLYSGTAVYYERFRLAYSTELIDDLTTRSGAAGTGRLLDLACGTGQLCFALHDRFAETCAVDQEREMIEVARAKALAVALVDIRWSAGGPPRVRRRDGVHRLPASRAACAWAILLRPAPTILSGGHP
jgi:SAM-dependent methyltransferase